MDVVLAQLPDGIDGSVALALIAASWSGAALTAAFGLGGGVFLLVVLLAVVPPTAAIPLHAVLQSGANAGRAWMMRRDVMRAVLPWFVAGSVVGVTLGSLIVVELPLRWLSLALALFILWSVWGAKPARRVVPPRAFAPIGAIGGFATLFLGATGALVAAFLPLEHHGRHVTVATHGALMTVQHLLKILAFGLLGFAFAEWLALLALMLASGFLGTWSGKRLLSRLPERVFLIAFRVLMTALALRLGWGALAGGG